MTETEDLYPENSTYRYIQDVRSRMINGVLIAFACVSPAMLAISLTRSVQHGWQLIYIIHTILACVTLAAALLRKRLSYRIRVSLFLGIAFVLGSIGLSAFGLVGGGHIILIIFAILAAIGFGSKVGLIACLINVILMVGIGFAVCTGRIAFPFDISTYATSPSAWGSVIIDFVLIVPMLILAIGTVFSQLQTTLQSEKENHASHQRLANNLTNSILYRYAESGKIEYASSVEQILGYGHEEFTDFTKFLTKHPLNHDAFKLPALNDKEEKRAPFEIQIYHKNGNKHWFQMSETIAHTRSGIKVEGVGHDITRRKIRETAIENILKAFSAKSEGSLYEEMIRQLAETLQCDMAFFGHLTGENQQTVQTDAFYRDGVIVENIEYPLSNTPCEKMVNEGVCIYPRGIQNIFPHVEMLKANQIEGYAGMPVINKSGKRIGFLIALSKEPSFDSDLVEPVFKIYAEHLVIEYEHRKDEEKHTLLEEQLRQSQKMDAIGQLAGGIAHDFNNMLMGIMGASEMLQMRLNNDTEAREYHSMIISSSRRAADLTRQLLTFARKQPIGSTRTDVHEAVNNAAALLTSTLDRRIKICTELAAENSTITGDSTQLQNAIMNLGINAAHSMPSGGRISIHSRVQTLGQTHCDSSSFTLISGQYITITVRDEGCGIEKYNLKKIFEPFFTTKALGEGTGLGLSTVLGTVQQHHGEIHVESTVNEGTSFSISLPLCANTPEDDSIIENPVAGTGRILLVDDEPIIQKTVSQMLMQLGYEVTVAENGEQGLNCFKVASGNFDLVILDLVMPEMNGAQCFFKMKEIDKNVRVILASGFATDKDIEELKTAGLCGTITKPFSSATLSRAALRVLRDGVCC